MKLNKIIAIATLGVAGYAAYKVATKKTSEPKEVEEVIEETVEEAVEHANEEIKQASKKKIIIAGVVIATAAVIVTVILKNKSVKNNSAEKDPLVVGPISGLEQLVRDSYSKGSESAWDMAIKARTVEVLHETHPNASASIIKAGSGIGIRFDDEAISLEEVNDLACNIYKTLDDLLAPAAKGEEE